MNLLNTKIQTIEGVSRTETFISRPTNRQTDSALRNSNLVHKIKLKKAISFIKRDGFYPYKGNYQINPFLIA
jgi:hypothetical protein